MNRALAETVSAETGFIVGSSPAMAALVETADRAARSEATLLLSGGSGTGKQVLAEHVHRQSERSGGPFVYVNCVAISDELIESTLFGHEKGAFTGAVGRKEGRLEMAVGSMPCLLQHRPQQATSPLRVILLEKTPHAPGVEGYPFYLCPTWVWRAT